MKRILVLFLALILVACGAPAPTVQPTAAPPQPTQTAAVVLQTVVVTVIPTQAATEAPSVTPLPPTEVAPTQAPATQPPAATEANTSGGAITLDDALGGGFFTNLTRSRNDFSLRCAQNKEITFTAPHAVWINPDKSELDTYNLHQPTK